MIDVASYVLRVADFFNRRLGAALVEVYKLGSLAHGGFSAIYSDIDVGLLLNGTEPPVMMTEALAAAKDLDSEYGKKLSVFWGNPDYSWGRLPVIDRLDFARSRRAAIARSSTNLSPANGGRDSSGAAREL